MDKLIEGKTKIITPYSEVGAFKNKEHQLVKVITKDSLTGNDGEIKKDLPLAKAKTIQNCNIFNILKSHGIPSAYVRKDLDSDTEFISKKCNMIPLECVLRRKPWGSYLKRHPMNDPLDVTFESPVAEFYYKVVDYPILHKTYNDPIIYIYDHLMLDASHTHESVWPSQDWYAHPPKTRFSPDNFKKIAPIVNYHTMEYIENELMRPTFRVLEDLWRKFNVTLVDLKIEVGYTVEDSDGGKNNIGPATGELVVADVIDNDSWRIWPNGNPKEQLDKQLFREGGDDNDVISNYEEVTHLTERMKAWYYRVGG